MPTTVHSIGNEHNSVVVIDDLLTHPQTLIDQAITLAPFITEKDNYYPGLRRVITPNDWATDDAIADILHTVAPTIGEVFGIKSFMPTESSFCLVTKRPAELTPLQRLPHYDHVDPDFLAVLLFLSPVTQGATNFYRHTATGYERIGPNRADAYHAARQREVIAEPPMHYFSESTSEFERIASFEARFNRLLVYRGSLLHSGGIPDDFAFSADPVQGRLTCNIFLQGQ